MDQETFSSIEHEIISLYAVWDMIDDMVNFDMFEGVSTNADTNVLLSTSTHTRLFNILLADFLAVPQADCNRKTLPFGLPRQASMETSRRFARWSRSSSNGWTQSV